MKTERDLVARAVRAWAPVEPSFDALRRRRDRKRRNQRIAAGAVAVAVAIAGALSGVAILRSSGVPADQPPRVLRGGELLEYGGTSGKLRALDPVTGSSRLLATCHDPCSDIWDPVLAPGGAAVAYTVGCKGYGYSSVVDCKASGGKEFGLWVVGAQGEPRQLTSWFGLARGSAGGAFASSPAGAGFAWSPDGARIVYGEPLDHPGLYVENADGGDRHLLPSTGDAGLARPTWSSDGSWIAYAVGSQIFVVSPDGGAPRVVATGVKDPEPRWSPDGSLIAFWEGRHVFVVPPLGGVPRQVGVGDDQDFSDVGPRWSPDGTELLYEDSGSVEVARADGSGTTTVGEGSGAIWAPDGRIVYQVERYLGKLNNGTRSWAEDLWAVAPDGFDRVHVLRSDCCSAIVDGSLTWSPDGSRIAFNWYSARDDGSAWRTVNADGSQVGVQMDDLPGMQPIEVDSWRPCTCTTISP